MNRSVEISCCFRLLTFASVYPSSPEKNDGTAIRELYRTQARLRLEDDKNDRTLSKACFGQNSDNAF